MDTPRKRELISSERIEFVYQLAYSDLNKS